MKRPANPPPLQDAPPASQEAAFTAEGAPPPKPVTPVKPAVPKPIVKGPAPRKGPPQGRYG